jgi:hypothetical protein
MSRPDSRVPRAIELMGGFAERTGIASDRPRQRYLWTDSFAVCNYLGLWRATGDEQFRRLALRLVDDVHRVLGRHRSDERRRGWISGLGDPEGEDHPTRGGLRIGKRLPERPGEPSTRRSSGTGTASVSYLTKWMHALDLVARSTRDVRFSRWARELAARTHAAFAHRSPLGGRSRLYWKMSIDLSRPLVPSMGQHDPLDGFVTLVQLQTTARAPTPSPEGPQLDHEIADLASMLESRDWTTDDPLGLGGLLMDAYRAQQLTRQGAPLPGELLEQLLEAARAGLSRYAGQDELRRPAGTRLAFRELGLAIGLQAADFMKRALDEPGGLAPASRGPQAARGAAALRWTSLRDRELLAGTRAPQGAELDRAPRHQRGHAGDQPRTRGLPGAAAAPVITSVGGGRILSDRVAARGPSPGG